MWTNVVLNRRVYLFIPLLLVLGLLLFYVRSDVYPTRSWSEFWNLGHIPLFMVLSYMALSSYPPLRDKGLVMQVTILVLASLVLGALIEGLQSLVGRQASLRDLSLDVTGTVIAVLLFALYSRRMGFIKGLLVFTVVGALLLFSSWRLLHYLWDEWQAYREFPVLADFESGRELGRWRSSERMRLTEESAFSGRHALRVDLTPRTYSGIEMVYFPQDWSGYDGLVLHVFNPQEMTIPLTVSIFDGLHVGSQFAYPDRYTKRFPLNHGWNELRVSLEDVLHAPRGRLMDMTAIMGLRLFVIRPQQGQYLLLDAVGLERYGAVVTAP